MSTFANVGPASSPSSPCSGGGGDVDVTLDFTWEPLIAELRSRERDQIASCELLAERLGQVAEAVRGLQLSVTSPDINFEPTIVVQPAPPEPIQIQAVSGDSVIELPKSLMIVASVTTLAVLAQVGIGAAALYFYLAGLP